MNQINIVVFGTSLLWGQGLEDADKMHNALARMLEQKGCQANITFLAHSGASTGYKSDGSIDLRHEPRIHGEVPTLYPTIVQEIEEFDGLGIASDSIDMILIDAGVNDVHVQHILDPMVFPRQLEKMVNTYCYDHMKLLMAQLLEKFQKAKIIIVGYYEFLTEESEEDYIHTLLKAFGRLPGGVIADAILEIFEGVIKRRLLKNCDVFAAKSCEAFTQTAAEMNKTLPAPRIFVAIPDIKTENAAFASDPYLYGINDDLSPEDPLAEVRKSACHAAGHLRTQVLFCEKASAGHPNPKGAKAYAESILALLEN